MLVFNEHKAKAHLSKILTLLESNDEIIIPRYEKPVTRLIPHEEPKMNRKFGAMNGVIKVALCSKAR